MAVLYPDGNSFPQSTFHGVPYHSFPFSLLHSSLSTLLSFVATLNMAMFTATVYGYRANCLFDPQSPISTVSPSFSIQFDSSRRNVGIPVAVLTTTGVFSCLVDLQPGAVDNVYDVRLGRDWFNFCTTAIPNAQILPSDDMCLMFSSSPLLAVRSRRTSEFLLS